MRVLHDLELAAAVRDMFSGEDDLRCAVAFWGPELAALARKRGAKVVLDISMGCTSRTALKALGVRRKRMSPSVGDSVRVLDGLHAKIFVGDKTAILGSANASGNALGSEGRAPALREAGVLIERASEPNAFAQVEAVWAQYLEASRPVRPDDLDRAPRVPVSRSARDQAPSENAPARSILDALLREPENFAETTFVFGDHRADPDEVTAGKEAYEEAQGCTPRTDGRTHVCLLNGALHMDQAMRRASQVITYWFGGMSGLYAYHDLIRVEHGDAGVAYFGRTGWPTVRKAIGLSRLSKNDIWKLDRRAAKLLSKREDEPKGERLVIVSNSELFEALEQMGSRNLG